MDPILETNYNYNNDVLQAGNKHLDEILRGEISAVESYKQVLEKVADGPEVFRLKQFLGDHVRAVSYWEKESRISGHSPEKSSSTWGTAVEAFVGASKLIGDETTLKALRLGERHGLSNYEKMLESDLINLKQKEDIKNVFIPNQRRHIEGIDVLLKVSRKN